MQEYLNPSPLNPFLKLKKDKEEDKPLHSVAYIEARKNKFAYIERHKKEAENYFFSDSWGRNELAALYLVYLYDCRNGDEENPKSPIDKSKFKHILKVTKQAILKGLYLPKEFHRLEGFGEFFVSNILKYFDYARDQKTSMFFMPLAGEFLSDEEIKPHLMIRNKYWLKFWHISQLYFRERVEGKTGVEGAIACCKEALKIDSKARVKTTLKRLENKLKQYE